MPAIGLERYGLTANPFRDLAGEAGTDVLLTHVDQEFDALVRTMREEVIDQAGRAVVALVGPEGSGKSEGLRLTQAEARQRSAFVVSIDMPDSAASALQLVVEGFASEAKARGLVGLLGGPSWLKRLAALTRGRKGATDAQEIGRAVGDALNAAAPSFLLLNDLHRLVRPDEASPFLDMLTVLTDVVKPGAMVELSSLPDYFRGVAQQSSGLISRLNRAITLPPLRDDEAGVLLAKRMLPKRIVEDLDPTYPFDVEAITLLNKEAQGNPRRFLGLADRALEGAVRQRAYRVDLEVARSILLDRPSVGPPVPQLPPVLSAHLLPPTQSTPP